jgi:hypothetical protein
MGSAFPVLGAVYHLAVGELAAIAEAAEYMELPAMGVATPLHHPAGIAAVQPEVGRRGCRRRSRPRERGRQPRSAISFHLLHLSRMDGYWA